MRTNFNTILFSSILLAIISPVAMAGAATLNESQADSLKCYSQQCYIESSGKYSATAFIPADVFYARGISLDTISDTTVIGITMGDFSFNKTLGEANKLVLTSTKLSAKWQDTHAGACHGNQCKSVVDTTVTVNTGSNGVTIKVSGNNKAEDSTLLFGSTVFAGVCATNGDGYLLSEPVSLSVDSETFNATVTGTCKVKTKTKIKDGTSYDLNNITVHGIASALN